MKRWIACLLFVMAAAVPAVAQDSEPGGGASPEADSPPDYRVGIEDVLRVVVWGEPELSLELMVRPDGKITLPLINDIHVAGLSTGEIRELITGKLTDFLNAPQVTVILDQYNSFRVFILGEVREQGEIRFQQPTRFLQALAAAGGITEFSKKDAVILRSVNGSEWRMPVDLKKLLSGASSAQDPYIQPNDTIVVN